MVQASHQARRPPSDSLEAAGIAAPRVLRFEAPWEWLAKGWIDLWAMPTVGIVYGALFALGAALMALGLWELGGLALFPVLIGGFLLIAPFLAVGLYEASRRREWGERIGFATALMAGRSAEGQLLFFGVALMIVFLVWLELAFVLLTIFMGGSGLPPPSEFLPTLLFTGPGLGLLIVGTVIGGLLAAFVFAMSVTAVPMLLTRRIDAVTAMRASFAAVVRNPKPMALWAALIAVMIAAGSVTMLLGFIVAFPLIGHATWHAYVDLYGTDPEKR